MVKKDSYSEHAPKVRRYLGHFLWKEKLSMIIHLNKICKISFRKALPNEVHFKAKRTSSFQYSKVGFAI
jgi:hypothetical protein